MRTYLFSGLVLCALAMAGPSMAASSDDGGKRAGGDEQAVRLTAEGAVAAKVFPKFDMNGDNVISTKEFDLQLHRVFSTWDSDNDKYLLPKDLPTPALKTLADTDRNSLVTHEEYLPKMLMLRNAMDTNGDSSVSAAEWRAYIETQKIYPEQDKEK